MKFKIGEAVTFKSNIPTRDPYIGSLIGKKGKVTDYDWSVDPASTFRSKVYTVNFRGELVTASERNLRKY